MKGNQLLRKAHSMFGWDWGPQTIDAGIFRDIYLQGYSHARIEDIRIHQQHAKNVSVQTSITLSESVPGQKLCVELSEDGADKPLQTKLCKTNADGVAAVDFVIENPKLWWPNDYGDQPLYIVRTTLLDEDGTSLESITRRIGLRTLTINQEKDEWGNEFAFCVNGVKIFTRGETIFRMTVCTQELPKRSWIIFWKAAAGHTLTASVYGVAVTTLPMLFMISVMKKG